MSEQARVSIKVRAKAVIAAAVLIATLLITALHTSSPDVDILGRYSTRFFVALVVYLSFTVVVTLLALRGVLPRVIGRFAPAPMIVVAILLAGLIWAFLPMQPEAKLYPSVVLLLFVWLLADVAPANNWWNRSLVRLLLALLVVGLLVELVTLLYLPAGHSYDEGAYANVAMRYLQTGRLPGDFLGFPPRHFIGFGSWLVTLGYWLNSFGFGWWSGRLYAFVASMLAVFMVYLAGSELYDRRAGIMAAVFAGLSSTFVETHSVRPDAPMVFLVAAGLWAYLRARKQPRPANYFLHGFLVMLSLEIHLLGLAFWAMYTALYSFDWLHACRAARRLLVPSSLIWFAAGCVIPAVVFVVTHVLPDWGLPSAIILGDRQFTVFGGIRKELNRWIEYVMTHPLEAMLVAWAVVYAVRHGQRAILAVAGTLMLAYVVVAPTDWPQYTRYFLPVVALMVGGMLARLRPELATAGLMLLFGALLGDAIKLLPAVRSGLTQRPTPAVVEFVTANVPPGSTIVMDMSYYLYFEDGHRYHYLQPGIHPPTISRLGGPPEDQVWASLAPDAIVIDTVKNERNRWLDDYLASARYVYLDVLSHDNIEIYVPPDSSLQGQV